MDSLVSQALFYIFVRVEERGWKKYKIKEIHKKNGSHIPMDT